MRQLLVRARWRRRSGRAHPRAARGRAAAARVPGAIAVRAKLPVAFPAALPPRRRAFASTGAVEGICAISGNFPNGDGPVPLSTQELLSCDVGTLAAPYADDGCDGGLAQNAFGYIQSTGGVCTEDEYTYASGNGHSYPCTHCTKRLTVGGYMTVEPGNEAALMHAVAQQPVVVAIQANSMQLQLYRSGVFDSPSCGKEPDHAVLLVGYGVTSTNVPYWKVREAHQRTHAPAARAAAGRRPDPSRASATAPRAPRLPPVCRLRSRTHGARRGATTATSTSSAASTSAASPRCPPTQSSASPSTAATRAASPRSRSSRPPTAPSRATATSS